MYCRQVSHTFNRSCQFFSFPINQYWKLITAFWILPSCKTFPFLPHRLHPHLSINFMICKIHIQNSHKRLPGIHTSVSLPVCLSVCPSVCMSISSNSSSFAFLSIEQFAYISNIPLKVLNHISIYTFFYITSSDYDERLTPAW